MKMVYILSILKQKIYNQFKKKQDIDPEDISQKKRANSLDDFGADFKRKNF